MQTIALEFKQLNKLPVPESRDEVLWIKQPDGNLIGCFPVTEKGILTFPDALLHSKWTYCHLKVTAATEPTFKVGDFVEVAGLKGFHYSIFRIADNQAWLIDTSGESRPIVPLTDLTLITE